MEKIKTKSPLRKAFVIAAKCLVVLLQTILMLAVTLYCVMFVLAKGPSPTARDLFVMSVRETSAVYWLADLFFTEEQIAAIEKGDETMEFEDTDTSLIQRPTNPESDTDNTDAWGLVDEDGDGIIVEPVTGDGFSGYMMVVLDPSRVIMGTFPEDYDVRGYTVSQMVEKYDAVAGINGGGFEDQDGMGDGSQPNTMIVYEGQIYYPEKGVRDGFVGIDEEGILHVGRFSASQAEKKNVRYGVGFGPVLISNGEAAKTYASGVNPRTGIGQRSDGAILMLVIDGRQVSSLGATYADMQQIFLEYGAVNACNLDGGSSTVMWYQGDYINHCASVTGIRRMPTTFLVLKEGVRGNE